MLTRRERLKGRSPYPIISVIPLSHVAEPRKADKGHKRFSVWL
jgi:hypothetical protein